MQNTRTVVTMLMLLGLGFGAWESIGPYGGYLRSVVVSQSNDNIIYVASYSTPTSIAKTTNAGNSWSTVGAIPTQAYCMAIDPLNDNNLYAGCGHSIYRSTNGGVNWISAAMTNKYIYAMTVHPTSPNNVFGSGMSWDGSQWVIAFFNSTNSGVNWTTTTPDTAGSYGYSLAVDRTNPNNIYVGGFYTSTSYPVIFKSTNGGTSFSEITGTIPTTAYYIYSLAVHPTNSNIVYAGTYIGGIYRSTDAGSSWTQASTHYYNYAMATSIAAPNIAYSGGYSDIYKTTDAGATWFSASSGIAGYNIYGLGMSVSNGNNVYAGDNQGFFKTSNGGSSWINSTNNLSVGAIGGFAVAPSSGSTIYTSLEEIGVFKTANNGTNWAQLPTPVGCGNICEIAVDYTNPNTIYALEGSGWGNAELYKSTDGGAVWSTAMDSYYADGGALVIDPNNNQTLYSGGYIYTTTYLMSVSKSTNGGVSWTRDTLETTTYSTCSALRVDPSNSNLVYAGGYTGFYKSTNAGNDWVKSSTGLTGTVNDIAVDPNNNTILYAGTSSGVFKSTNSGTSWSSTGLTGVTSLAIDITTSTTIYAGTSSGVYYSTNGGSNWTLMNTGLFNTNISSLGVNHNNYLFTGTDGASMYRWSLAVGMQENSKNIVPMNISCQPNPAKGNLTINYTLDRDQHANLSVYDIQGRQIATIINARQTAGDHSALWPGINSKGCQVPTGVYFCKLITADATAIEKIIMIK